MRNLRLTEANSPSALLAKTMQNGTNTDGTSKTAIVSNITLEGEITNRTSDLGGLINTVSGGEINTVTSMLKITQNATGSSEYSLGGLIGHIDEANQSEVKIYYCSNYGPITGESKGRAVGGLVGSTSAYRNGTDGNITIDHCFNGSSVLAGYTSGTNYDEQLYYAGGIIGTIHGGNNISIQITNCYNAGIIKAGNKTHTKMSYAAGIVAHSEITDTNKVQISNCYNEGSIEALGIDPETAIQYATDSAGNDIVQVISKTDINVSAYYIADIEVDNCGSIEADILQEGDEPYYLQRNGSTTDSDEVIYQVDYKSKLLDYFGTSEKNRVDEPIPSEDHGIFNPDDVRDTFWGYDGPYDRYDILWDKGFIIYYSDRGFGGSNAKIQFQYDNKQDSWYNLQYGVNNIPIVFADYQSYTVKAYLLAFNSYSNPSSSQGEAGWCTSEANKLWDLNIYDLFVYPNPTKTNVPTYHTNALN